ncbi:MAG: phosphate--acyl-ACP acyltransferase, partial [Coriobacteriales bacterium]|nr:phosphate--acyl-ACP acyltransferase [Coriobacteriales bacterium]
KGSQFAQECHAVMKEQVPNFIGNAEGKNIALGGFDVIVTDGFTGNVALKTFEGAAKALLKGVKEALHSSLKAKIGGLLIKDALKDMMANVSTEEFGGAQLLGVRGVCLIGHGNSSARAIRSGVLATARAIRQDMPGRLTAELDKIRAAQTAPTQKAGE